MTRQKAGEASPQTGGRPVVSLRAQRSNLKPANRVVREDESSR